MVNLKLIQQSNSSLSTTRSLVAVSVGGTAGIGLLTLQKLVHLNLPITAYIIGRAERKSSFQPIIDNLHASNPSAKLIWLEAEISLLSDIHRICTYIKTLTLSINLLLLTPGYAPFRIRQNTFEGLDISHALCFYSRICFIENLLPQLRLGHGRVVSVHSGGLERSCLFNTTDLNLEQPGAFGAMSTQPQMGVMGTLTLERLAEKEENADVTFMHSHPGIVRTGNLFRGFEEGSWGHWGAKWVMDPLMRVVEYSFEEAAERHVFQCTSGVFGGRGPVLEGVVGRTTRGEEKGGLFLVNWKCDTVMNEWELGKLRTNAQEVVWEKVHEMIGPHVVS